MEKEIKGYDNGSKYKWRLINDNYGGKGIFLGLMNRENEVCLRMVKWKAKQFYFISMEIKIKKNGRMILAKEGNFFLCKCS